MQVGGDRRWSAFAQDVEEFTFSVRWIEDDLFNTSVCEKHQIEGTACRLQIRDFSMHGAPIPALGGRGRNQAQLRRRVCRQDRNRRGSMPWLPRFSDPAAPVHRIRNIDGTTGRSFPTRVISFFCGRLAEPDGPHELFAFGQEQTGPGGYVTNRRCREKQVMPTPQAPHHSQRGQANQHFAHFVLNNAHLSKTCLG